MVPMDSAALPMSRKDSPVTSVLFVCMANICRSPALMATLRHLAAKQNIKLHVDSCGVGWVHLGERPDPRSFEAAQKKGIVIDHRAEQFQESFFEAYDWILAVNQDVAEQLKLRGPQYQNKIKLATEFSAKFKGEPIPDPYYMGPPGFDQVMEIVIDCCEGFIRHLKGRS